MQTFSTFTVKNTENKKSIAIIGHMGKMGHMLFTLWKKANHEVCGIDILQKLGQNESTAPLHKEEYDGHLKTSSFDFSNEELFSLVDKAEVVVLCTPVKVFGALCKKLAALLQNKQILIDVGSVKMLPMQYMQEHYKGPVVGTHPLFGPVSRQQDHVVAITQGSQAKEKHALLIAELFHDLGCQTFFTTAEEHDRGVAFAQALNFATNAMYFACVAEQKNLQAFLTPSFKRRLEAAKKQLTEDANMFIGISNANPQMQEALNAFQQTLFSVKKGELESLVRTAQTWYTKQDTQ